jgi:hypothetical protein
LTDEVKNLDLSSKSFDQFVDFFFPRDSPISLKPEVMVCHSPAITAKPVLARESSYGTMSAENYVQ